VRRMKRGKRQPIRAAAIRRNWDLYLLLLPVFAYFIVFHYYPMYGVQIAFKDFLSTKGIWGSPFIGFGYFQRFFKSYFFWRLLRNTLGISVYQLAVGFPAPLILALMLNQLRSKRFRKTVQLVTYAPHFLSTVVVVGMLGAFLSPRNGVVNQFLVLLGMEPVFFMTKPGWFKSLYVLSGVWQNAGWGSIIYIAAISSIDPQLYEAAHMDGAGSLQRILHVTIPCILPTAVILLILNVGQLMNVGFEKVFLMQNDMNLEASDVISTYVYRSGILRAEYSFSAAVGLFNSVVNFILLVTVNSIARSVTDTGLW
jgi:putative aldouronate transport system permease protein